MVSRAKSTASLKRWPSVSNPGAIREITTGMDSSIRRVTATRAQSRVVWTSEASRAAAAPPCCRAFA